MTDPVSPLVCPTCGTPFEVTKAARGGHNRKFCSVNCRALATNRAYRAANPERARAWWRKSHAKNREKKNARSKAWQAENREYVAEKHREYYEANKERLKANMRAYHHANREEHNRVAREKGQIARAASPGWKGPLRACKMRAAQRKIEFTLTEEWAASRWTGRCELTDIEFTRTRDTPASTLRNPSIDRIDPTLGYVPDNCRFILWSVNSMKHIGSDSDISDIAEAIVKKNLSKSRL